MSLRTGVLGGTGTAGRAVVRELSARGHAVAPLSRRGERPADVTRAEGLLAVRNPEQLAAVPALAEPQP
jgi:uncharacterized protein YbjT (DUF2867 family)